MIKTPAFCLTILLTLFSCAFTVRADDMKTVDGSVVEIGELTVIRVLSEPARLLKFGSDIPKYEMTTGLTFAGDVSEGQLVRLVYSGEPADGMVRGEYLLFNPDSPMAADIGTLLLSADDGVFLSDDGQYRLYADADTDITDSQGRQTSLRNGQYILGWFREAVFQESAVLSKAVVLNLLDEAKPCRQIRITDSGDVLLDDGPIAKLDGYQTDFCHRYHMAPIRPIAEALGYTVEWGDDQSVYIRNAEYEFYFNINDDYYQINDKFVYFSDKRFILLSDQTFADYSVINTLVSKSGPLNTNAAGHIIRKNLEISN